MCFKPGISHVLLLTPQEGNRICVIFFRGVVFKVLVGRVTFWLPRKCLLNLYNTQNYVGCVEFKTTFNDGGFHLASSKCKNLGFSSILDKKVFKNMKKFLKSF